MKGRGLVTLWGISVVSVAITAIFAGLVINRLDLIAGGIIGLVLLAIIVKINSLTNGKVVKIAGFIALSITLLSVLAFLAKVPGTWLINLYRGVKQNGGAPYLSTNLLAFCWIPGSIIATIFLIKFLIAKIRNK